VHGSPFDPDGDGARQSVRIELQTLEPAAVTLRIHDFDGRRVRTLARSVPLDGARTWTWQGRDGSGRKIPYGPYRVKATFVSGGRTLHRVRWLTRALTVPYARRPGAITVALDPGHGGPAAGAVWEGLAEDRVNLDIALRLEAMLEGAGIGVVMTRRSDRNVSPVGKDLDRDGRYTRVDELIARNDVANQARADVHLALHNNATGCHCQRGTEMYTHFGRSWSPEGRQLAGALLRSHLWHLSRLPGYRPRDRGVKSKGFKALKPYHPVAMPRPSLQPSVLGESLFIDWPSEHRILDRRSGRAVVATAYFDGISRYLAARRFGLRYEVLEVSRTVPARGRATVTVRLTNTGRQTSSAWRLAARVVKRVPRYDGRPRRGDVVAKVPIPDGLAPGDATVVTLPAIRMPRRAGRWLVKLDVNLPGDDALSRHGVVGPQLRVSTSTVPATVATR
jgi:N-acetylmuramoyl-L-alanine amidase